MRTTGAAITGPADGEGSADRPAPAPSQYAGPPQSASVGAARPPATGPAPQPRSAPAAPDPAGGIDDRVLFRMPDRHNPVPHPARLFAICTWAAVLGLLGLPVAAWAAVATITGPTPGWFAPVMVAAGLFGIVATSATFTAMHRRWLPWYLLLLGTAALLATLLLTLEAG
ncbi:MAG TPA: hypothetical protein VIL37_00855 [Natronosporangium sp.]